MKTFKIPCFWEVYGYLNIDAENFEEALRKAHEEEDMCELPQKSFYVDGSFKIDDEIAECVSERLVTAKKCMKDE